MTPEAHIKLLASTSSLPHPSRPCLASTRHSSHCSQCQLLNPRSRHRTVSSTGLLTRPGFRDSFWIIMSAHSPACASPCTLMYNVHARSVTHPCFLSANQSYLVLYPSHPVSRLTSRILR
ncbi:hypothetical protein EJ04DRAFT_7734 [Polyplosphaeria fusca]|uniref:Uncharacterized protein n=1 Tax=Polyplosphaeria fusca TaxID=682080 RepID=A0A9P4R8B6_9PLEO|nr:hypothetical protein EJ04DRAFT_7734 [Polyplosphaeria fusca]